MKREIGTAGMGLIVPCPSGFTFTNQTGGYACHQRAQEGVFVPIDDYAGKYDELAEKFLTLKDWLNDYFINGKDSPYHGHCYNGLTLADRAKMNRFLTFMEAGFRVNQARLKDSEEAWVHVLITRTTPSLKQGERAIFVWDNSD